MIFHSILQITSHFTYVNSVWFSQQSVSAVTEIFIPFHRGECRDSKRLGLVGPHNSCVTEQTFIPCRISTALDLGVSPNKDTVS